MRQIVVRNFKSKAGGVMAAAVLDVAQSAEELEAPDVVVLIARRDLVWLQHFFKALDRKKVMDYKRMQSSVSHNLDALSRTNGSNPSAMSKDNESKV